MLWLLITVFAYFLNSIAVVVDKFLLTKKITNPAVYAFFISALSLLALVLVPFGFKFYSWEQIIIALIAGLIFAFALFFMFKALKQNEASRITPFMGGWQPILVFILALFFLGELFSLQTLAAFILIVIGTVFISYQKTTSASTKKEIFTGYFFALISTLLFAISYTINKYVFLNQDFISGFVWTRIGAFLGALILLFWANNRQDIAKEIKKPQKKTSGLFLLGQACGAISFILVNYAIAISQSVAVVNALRGLEYVFLLIIVGLLAFKYPRLLSEKMTRAILIQKIIALALIIVGLTFLTLGSL